MDTEKMFLTDETFNLVCEELSENDLKIARHYVEVTRHLQETHHLFLIFKNDIDNLQKEYVLENTGNVFCGQNPAENEDDYIAINAYTISIISAGRTLVESMECYIKNNTNIDDTAKQRYLDFYHKTYDSSFAYRLLIRLRDYSQHGHLPVSSMRNNYYFDLIQIVDKPHYNHNKTFENQMKNIIDEILTKYHDTPTIALTETLAEFVVKLLSIYKMFWYQTEDELNEAYNMFQNVISDYSDNIITQEDCSSGLFVYDIVGSNAHVVNSEDNVHEAFIKFKNEAEALYNEYNEAYKEVLSGNLYISYSENQLVVGTGTEFAKDIIECELS